MAGLAAAAVLCAAGVAAYAAILQARRPLRALYRARAAEEDFIPAERIPERFRFSLLQVEDRFFFEHNGFSKLAIRDAIRLNFKARKVIAGGSTMSQQLVKNLYFRFHHNVFRKAAEVIITAAAERKLGKDRILEMYINIIYFGCGIYGLTHAARFYFGKEPEELTMNQMFLLACVVNAPTRGNPVEYPEVFERLRNKRVALLIRRGTIPDADAEAIKAHGAACLDEELRGADEVSRRFSQEVPMVNDRFGPRPDPDKFQIPRKRT